MESCVWKRMSQKCSNPSTSRYQLTRLCMSRVLLVMWSMWVKAWQETAIRVACAVSPRSKLLASVCSVGQRKCPARIGVERVGAAVDEQLAREAVAIAVDAGRGQGEEHIAGGHRTPVEGLYLSGAGTAPGGGVSAVPGRDAAKAMLADLGKRR